MIRLYYRKYYVHIVFHCLQGYFNTFAIENISENVPVTLVCPGPVHSNLLSQAFTEKAGEVS